jgi:predicted small lipoprotein YifL
MQTLKTTLLILISITLLGACGLKGPLYLPEDKAAAEPATAPAEDAEKDKEKEKGHESNSGKESTGH